MIKLAAWLKRHYGCTMNQALKTVIPVKDEVGHKQKKSVCLLVDTKKAQELISIYEKKAKAKYRLMCALIDEPVTTLSMLFILSTGYDGLSVKPITYPVIILLPFPKGTLTDVPISTLPSISSGTAYWNVLSSCSCEISIIISAYIFLL